MISVSYLYHATIGVCYFVAFRSLYYQYPGLFGYNGIVPGDIFISKTVNQLTSGSSLYQIFLSNVQLDCLVDYLFIVGTSASIFIVTGFHSSIFFLTTFICYLLIYTVGQEVFLSFQWDILLLEIGFLSIFTSPYIFYPNGGYGKSLNYKIKVNWLYAIRFLSFKLMFLSGIAKIQAGCPTWSKLSALEYHYATQPLPTSYAWLAAQLPPIINRFLVALTLVTEIPIAILLICPIGFIRRFAGSLQVLLQLGIMITGNYNFFNVLTIALMMPSFVNDTDENKNSVGETKIVSTNEKVKRFFDGIFLIIAKASFCLLLLYLSFNWMIDFNYAKYIDNVHQNYWWKGDIISVKDKFWEDILLPILPTIYTFVLLTSIISSVYCLSSKVYYRNANKCNIMLRIKSSFFAATSIIFSVMWILLAAVPLDRTIMKSIIPKKIINLSSTLSNTYHCFASYGLFRHMTGVGSVQDHNVNSLDLSYVARPEIILEGYDNTTETWKEIPFLYKPGSLNLLPFHVVPDQPRLDWQIWFAALSPYQYNHWLIYLTFILLKSSDNNEVIKLLDHYPFKNCPPQFIRASLYDYDFSHINQTWFTMIPHSEIVPLTNNELIDIFSPFNKYNSSYGKSNWWRRRNQREYLPIISLDNVKSVVPYKDRCFFISISIIFYFIFNLISLGNINRLKTYIECVARSIKINH